MPDWLAENGLAWIGGGALALGGLMLVAYAAQHGLFTPLFRVLTAIVIGMASMAAGEYLRRSSVKRRESLHLVASLSTAAGASILYAAFWSAYVLYHFIPLPLTALLLAFISFGLLGLALLHSEALGILAIVGAFVVPIVTGGVFWEGGALDAYLLLIATTGLACAGLRQWLRVGHVTLAAIGIWALQRAVMQDASGVVALALATPALALAAAVMERRRFGESPGPQPKVPVAALAGAASLVLMLWVGLAGLCSAPLAATATVALLALAALGIRLRVLGPRMLLVPAAIPVFVATLSLLPTTVHVFAPAFAHAACVLAALASVAGAGMYGAITGPDRRSSAMIGAAAAALGLTLLGPSLAQALPKLDILVDLGFAALFGLGTLALARSADDSKTDIGLAAWIGAAAEAVGLALHAGTEAHLAPTAYGLLAIALAGLAVRVRWRGLAEAATVACLASFASLLGPAEAGAAFSGQPTWIVIAGVAAGAALTQALAWRLLRARKDAPAATDAVSTLSVLSALLGAFLVVQCWSAPAEGAAGLDAFTAASLRTLLVLAAGVTLTLRGAATPLGRWRAPAFLAIGAAHGLLLEGLVLHPWWGFASPVAGPPIVDTLLLGLLVPGVLLGVSAPKLHATGKAAAPTAVGAVLGFLMLWIVSEVRRLFHGPDLGHGGLSYEECSAYALAFFGLGLVIGAQRARLARAFSDA
ncbi:MAG: DUF2339 domain-containing protein, partial [Pseudomonadota bacterium]|nr:DUF2339 domain-containing protein [Pseudomonadota bacterium]